jgi:hypothetical protein
LLDAHRLGTAIVHEQPRTQATPIPLTPAIYHSRLHLVECTAIRFSSAYTRARERGLRECVIWYRYGDTKTWVCGGVLDIRHCPSILSHKHTQAHTSTHKHTHRPDAGSSETDKQIVTITTHTHTHVWETLTVCVFITAGPSSKLFAWGGGGYWGTCATRDDEPRPVWTSLLPCCVCVFITAGPSTKLFTLGGGDMERQRRSRLRDY